MRGKHILSVSGDPGGLPWNGEWTVIGEALGEMPHISVCGL